MMNKTLWPGNFNSTTFMMNKTHLVVKGTPKFDGADQLQLSNWKDIDHSEILIERPSQSEFQI